MHIRTSFQNFPSFIFGPNHESVHRSFNVWLSFGVSTTLANYFGSVHFCCSIQEIKISILNGVLIVPSDLNFSLLFYIKIRITYRNLLLRLEELPSRCCLAGVSDECERSLEDAIETIPVLLLIFGSALPFIDGRKKGIVGKGLFGSPLLLLFMAPWCLSDPRMRSLTPIPPIFGGLKLILLPKILKSYCFK